MHAYRDERNGQSQQDRIFYSHDMTFDLPLLFDASITNMTTVEIVHTAAMNRSRRPSGRFGAGGGSAAIDFARASATSHTSVFVWAADPPMLLY
jgi:hypothetical protein